MSHPLNMSWPSRSNRSNRMRFRTHTLVGALAGLSTLGLLTGCLSTGSTATTSGRPLSQQPDNPDGQTPQAPAKATNKVVFDDANAANQGQPIATALTPEQQAQKAEHEASVARKQAAQREAAAAAALAFQAGNTAQDGQPAQGDAFTSTLNSGSAAIPQADATQAIEPQPVELPKHREGIYQWAQDAMAEAEAPAWQKAVDRVALAAAEGQTTLPTDVFKDLSIDQAKKLTDYHQLLLALGQELARQGTKFDADQIRQHIGRTPDQANTVEIADLKLCSQVRGFGQYTELDQTSFLAGKAHPMVIYTELDGFASKKLTNGEFETRVSQALKLYKTSDDIVVWEQPAQQLVDTSRKRRQDFFLVQTIQLPANLGSGSYMLKVTIVDQNSQTLWEESLPVNLVTQAQLVQRRTQTTGPANQTARVQSTGAWGQGG